MDFTLIHRTLANTYWAKNIPVSTMQTAMKNSSCFGVFLPSKEQVAFARIITDHATFAYLSDVFVLAEHRGKGLSKWLLDFIFQQPNLQGLRRMLLATSDAHGLYKKLGFSSLTTPETFMEKHQPDVYHQV